MESAEQIISVDKLHISFGEKSRIVVVNDLSFSINKGKTLAIVGESGSGKSLTALALMGLLPANANVDGEIIFNPTAQPYSLTHINNRDWIKLRGKEEGIIFQEPMSALNPIMKIGRQLKEAIAVHTNTNNKDAKRIAIEWLNKVQLPTPEKIYDRYPHQLSGGQKQRVMIAMAMCHHPLLLIADEPTTALDVTVQQEIIRLMGYLQQEHHTAMLFITHDLALATEIADDILVMQNGSAVEYGITAQILNTPVQLYTKALFASRPSQAQKGKRLLTVADLMENNVAPAQPNKIIKDDNRNLLSVDNLRVWFPEKNKTSFKAVDGVSFSINKGEVLGLLGESGCGKSTLSRALMGLLPVTDGNIYYDGNNVTGYSSRQWNEVRKYMQIIFQDPYASLNPRMTIGNIISEPMKVHSIVPDNQLAAETKRLLDLVHLPSDAMHRYPHQFSGGQRQRIGIARALALRPQILICDESVSALDVSVQAQILNLMKDLQYELGLTYLFISHDLAVVHYISDRIMVMKEGKIVETGTADAIINNPQNDYTRRLLNAMPKMSA
ncbi:MAG: ABC transporter ATP-binding protein [Taibaiella sp.]|nr:ABC transporter ATP-binding protein [Taibaiella sp.]